MSAFAAARLRIAALDVLVVAPFVDEFNFTVDKRRTNPYIVR